jgi:hypothetical protein
MVGLLEELKKLGSKEDNNRIAEILNAVCTIYFWGPKLYGDGATDSLLGQRRCIEYFAGESFFNF